jgi:hypothetical protein
MVSGESRERRGNILSKVPVALWRIVCKCFEKNSLVSNRRPRYFTVLDQGMVTLRSWRGCGYHQGLQNCAWLKFLVVVYRHFVVCLVGVWQRNFEAVVCVYGTAVRRPFRTHTPQVQNYAAKHRPSTRQNICEPLRGIPGKCNSVIPDYGTHKIRNMSEWFLILCLLNFYTI